MISKNALLFWERYIGDLIYVYKFILSLSLGFISVGKYLKETLSFSDLDEFRLYTKIYY